MVLWILYHPSVHPPGSFPIIWGMNYCFSVKCPMEWLACAVWQGARFTKNYLSSSTRITLSTMSCLHPRETWNHVQLKRQWLISSTTDDDQFHHGAWVEGLWEFHCIFNTLLFWNIFMFIFNTAYAPHPVSPVKSYITMVHSSKLTLVRY